MGLATTLKKATRQKAATCEGRGVDILDTLKEEHEEVRIPSSDWWTAEAARSASRC